jgi:hypothetical protein
VAAPVSVIDNGTPGYTETAGTWNASSLQGYNGTGSRYSTSANAEVTWAPTLTAGFYTIDIFKLATQSSSTNAHFSIVHHGQTETQTIDLRAATAGFVTVPGTFYFDGSAGELVKLTQGASVGTLRADAVRFTKVPTPIALIDNGTTGYAETGTWATSGVTGYNGTNTRYSAQIAATATWTPALAGAGMYRVSFYRVSNAASQTNAKLTLTHNGGTDSPISIDLTGPAGFVDLGVFQFNGSGSELLKLSQTTAGTLRADAVRFTKVS